MPDFALELLTEEIPAGAAEQRWGQCCFVDGTGSSPPARSKTVTPSPTS
jgi:hypothetical protein